MTRSSCSHILDIDPEIERTLHALNRARRIRERTTSEVEINIEFETKAKHINNTTPMADNMQNWTLRELAAPDVNYQPLCIQYPDLDADFELKSGLIHLLPKFHGLAGEDPHKHLKEFQVVCSTMKPQGIAEEHIKLRAFPFSLDGVAKDWLYYLQPRAITGWNDMKRVFLEKFFPASRAAAIRKDICGIRQLMGETLYEYWERFKKLCASCPHYQITDHEGLLPMDRSMVDAASGGALVDKTLAAAGDLIANMAANSQQFGTRMITPTRGVNEVQLSNADQQRLEHRLDELTSLMRQLIVDRHQPSVQGPARVCSICSCPSHSTDACPTLQDDSSAFQDQFVATGVFPGKPQFQQQQQRYDPFSNTYNSGWRDHPNLRYGNAAAQQQYKQTFQQPMQSQQSQQQAGPSRPPFQKQPQGPATITSEPTLEDLMKQMATNNIQFQQRTEASIQSLETQIGQLASTLSQLQHQGSGQLPSQTIPNPKGNVSSIMLRSGKTVEVESQPAVNKQLHKPSTVATPDSNAPTRKSDNDDEKAVVGAKQKPQLSIALPFPQRATQSKKIEEAEKAKELLETFRKVEVNIPLLDAIKQIPKYAKFLKELCTHKRRLKGNERISLGQNVSALIQPMPQKCKDPGTFTIPCIIGNCGFETAMLDLGASINVMPMSIYNSLELGPLQTTGAVIQLANRSYAYPSGLVEDVLV